MNYKLVFTLLLCSVSTVVCMELESGTDALLTLSSLTELPNDTQKDVITMLDDGTKLDMRLVSRHYKTIADNVIANIPAVKALQNENSTLSVYDAYRCILVNTRKQQWSELLVEVKNSNFEKAYSLFLNPSLSRYFQRHDQTLFNMVMKRHPQIKKTPSEIMTYMMRHADNPCNQGTAMFMMESRQNKIISFEPKGIKAYHKLVTQLARLRDCTQAEKHSSPPLFNFFRESSLEEGCMCLQAFAQNGNKHSLALHTDTLGFTPLHYAARTGNRQAVKFFIDAAPESVNLTAHDGKTALYCVIQDTHNNDFEVIYEIATILLDAGANPEQYYPQVTELPLSLQEIINKKASYNPQEKAILINLLNAHTPLHELKADADSEGMCSVQ